MANVSDTPDGIDSVTVTRWLVDNIAGAVAPFQFDLIAGGRSNLTFRVTGADGVRYVLRRPPLGHVLATAHDMAREFKIISALGPTSVPVAPALGLCSDVAVNAAPFYVMGFVEGLVLATLDDTTTMTPAAMRLAGESLIDVLAELHAIDPDAVGLGDLGRKEAYVERQLKRWKTQWDNSKTRELAEIDEVHRLLSARIPAQIGTGIVHGDYRLGNSMVGPDGKIRAVLDWELCTLGDTMADLGYTVMFWTEPGEFNAGRVNEPTQAAGYITKREGIDRYASRTGRDVSGVDFYISLAFWRLACITEGVLARYVHGAMGSNQSIDLSAIAEGVRLLAQSALDSAKRLV